MKLEQKVYIGLLDTLYDSNKFCMHARICVCLWASLVFGWLCQAAILNQAAAGALFPERLCWKAALHLTVCEFPRGLKMVLFFGLSTSKYVMCWTAVVDDKTVQRVQ